MKPLAILRPEPGNSATAARARAMGFAVRQLPIFDLHAIDWNPPDPAHHDALLLTSANTLRFGGAALTRYRALPVLAVGTTTAAAARALGFAVLIVGAGDAAMLVQLAQARGIRRALHLGGRERRLAPDAPVSARVDVYAAEPVFPAARVLGALAGTIALLHSPRAAAHFGALVDAAPVPRRGMAIGALSDAVAAAAGTGWDAVTIAAAPSDAALLSAIRILAD